MKRRIIIGAMAVTLAIIAARTPAGGKLVDGARSFGRQFHSLRSAQTMNPIERFVLSLMLAS
jgi:hypothetical protein